ncbi:MAG: redoxin domain-containing protein [Proteobacteria bacterium]|nr:redoxin domain-containing protein [Pseudomonadota bacterium]
MRLTNTMGLLCVIWFAAVGSVAASPASQLPEGPPWLGVVITDGLHGARVNEVIAETPADDAGLIPGDEITAVADTRVATFQALKLVLSQYRVSDRVTLKVWRDGRVFDIPAILGAKLTDSEILYQRLVGRPAPDFDLPAVEPVGRAGVGSLDSLRGKVAVMYFFDTHCRECADLYRPLSRLADQRRRDGMAVLALSRESRDVLDAWARRWLPSFAVLHDTYGEVARMYRIDQRPALVVVNRKGEVCYAGIGQAGNLKHAIFAAERALDSGRRSWAR